MDDQSQKAFDFAQETTKQLLGLATGVIALTITFSNDFVETVPDGAKQVLFAGWLVLLASVLFGILTLMALTGTLGRASGEPATIYRKNVTLLALLQALTFFIGVLLTVVFGIRAVS